MLFDLAIPPVPRIPHRTGLSATSSSLRRSVPVISLFEGRSPRPGEHLPLHDWPAQSALTTRPRPVAWPRCSPRPPHPFRDMAPTSRRPGQRSPNPMSLATVTGPGCCHGEGTTLGHERSWWSLFSWSTKHAAGMADGWFLAAPVSLSFDDGFAGGGDEPVDGGLGEQRAGHHG